MLKSLNKLKKTFLNKKILVLFNTIVGLPKEYLGSITKCLFYIETASLFLNVEYGYVGRRIHLNWIVNGCVSLCWTIRFGDQRKLCKVVWYHKQHNWYNFCHDFHKKAIGYHHRTMIQNTRHSFNWFNKFSIDIIITKKKCVLISHDLFLLIFVSF